MKKDKESYEKDYQAEWRKCIYILRETLPYLRYVEMLSPYQQQKEAAKRLADIVQKIEDVI